MSRADRAGVSKRFIAALTAAALLGAAMSWGPGAVLVRAATTFVVNTTDDLSDGECDETHCSLREAISNANLTEGIDEIHFGIGGTAPYTIQPASALPTISDPVILDGTTQPGYDGSPVVEIDGSLAPADPATDGLYLGAGSDGSTVSGLAVNRFSRNGIVLESTTGNTIIRNYVGTDVTGEIDLGNGKWGIALFNNANGNSVGTGAAPNLVSGNGNVGVFIGQFSSSNAVASNLIGTDAGGLESLPNGFGLQLNAATNNVVSSNVISGNSGEGLIINGSMTVPSSSNDISFNLIGVGGDGATPLGNGNSGVWIGEFGNDTDIIQNVIAHNGSSFDWPGVLVFPNSTGNAISANVMFDNSGLGIDLSATSGLADGVTANETGDADTGGNELQNYPTLESATQDEGGDTLIEGSLSSAPSSTYLVQFFRSPDCDGSGFGEGNDFLGSQAVNTDESGLAGFQFIDTSDSISVGDFITSTATDASNNTSEFSQCEVVTGEPQPSISITDVSAPELTGDGLHEFVFDVTLDAASTETVTVAFATTDGTAIAPGDYGATSGTLTFLPGDTSEEIPVSIVTDDVPEADETFTVDLTNATNATIGDAQGLGTIENDDAPPLPFVYIEDASEQEGDEGTTPMTFTVGLTDPSDDTVIVQYHTEDGTATAEDEDYEPTSEGAVVFEPGSTEETIDIDVIGDADVEGDEDFFVVLSDPENAQIADGGEIDGTGTGTILDDDASVAEADLGVSLTDTPDPVTTGQTLRYESLVTNTGPDSATNVELFQTMPEGATFAGASHESCSETEGGNVACDLGTLTSGASDTVIIDVTAPATPGSISSTVSVSADEDDPNGENNVDTEGTTVQSSETVEDQAGGFATGEEQTTVQTSSDDPVQFSQITVPEGVSGAVVMSESATPCGVPGIVCFGEELDLQAPDAPADNPLVLKMFLGKKGLPKGTNAKKIRVYHQADGAVSYVRVPDCAKKSRGVVNPTPSCVSKIRAVDVNGIRFFEITILTTENGKWRPGSS